MALRVVGWGLMTPDVTEECYFKCGAPLTEAEVYVTVDGMEMFPAHSKCIPVGTPDMVANSLEKAFKGRES